MKKIINSVCQVTQLRQKLGMLWQKIELASFTIKSTNVTEISQVTASTKKIDARKSIHKEPFFSIGDKFTDECTIREVLLVIFKIRPLLKRNNALFPQPVFTKREERTFSTLIKKGIVLRVKGFQYYILNPEYVRRGNVTSVVASTYEKLIERETKKCEVYVHLTMRDNVYRDFLDEEDIQFSDSYTK